MSIRRRLIRGQGGLVERGNWDGHRRLIAAIMMRAVVDIIHRPASLDVGELESAIDLVLSPVGQGLLQEFLQLPAARVEALTAELLDLYRNGT